MNILLLLLPCSNYLPKYCCIFIPYLFLQVRVVLAANAEILSVSTIHVEDMESGSPLPKHLQNSTFKKVITLISFTWGWSFCQNYNCSIQFWNLLHFTEYFISYMVLISC